MYKTVEGHTERLDEHGEKLDNHGQRIDKLEKSDAEIIKELKGLKHDFTNLENTIWKTSQATQDMMSNTMERQWALINARDENRNAESERQHELAKTKLEKWSEVIIKVGGAGGILIILAELLFGN